VLVALPPYRPTRRCRFGADERRDPGGRDGVLKPLKTDAGERVIPLRPSDAARVRHVAGRQGVPERVAQELAGHADSRMTREVCTHVTRRTREQAADAMITRMVEGREWVHQWGPTRRRRTTTSTATRSGGMTRQFVEWGRQVSNLRPLACKTSELVRCADQQRCRSRASERAQLSSV
jgi:hypothetical protein